MDLEAMHRVLGERRKEIIASIRHLERGRLDVPETWAIEELSAYDNHPADLGTATFEREKEVGIRMQADRLLAEVEGALHRLDDGNYGRCLVCGREIPEERLEAEPWAERCLVCEKISERGGKDDRPVEEELLSPPFGRSFRDHDPEGTVEFDGEDAWQAVARWGSSNSPSDVPPAVTYDETYVNSQEPIGTVEDVEGIPEKHRARTRSGDLDV